MKHTTLALTGLLALSACSTAAVGTLPATQSPSAGSLKLQLAVGTARIGLDNGSSFVGLNVVETFRQSNGTSATLQNTPTLTGPAGSGVFAGSDSITGTTPAVLHQYATTSLGHGPGVFVPTGGYEFGDLVGAYGYGLAPLNLIDLSDNVAAFNANASCNGPINATGQPGLASTYYPSASPNRPDQAIPLPLMFTLQPGTQPNGTPCSETLQLQGGSPPVVTVTPFTFLGGPPAWPSPVGAGVPSGFLGYPAGFTDFVVNPAPGPYTLQVAYPTNSSDTTSTMATATANLAAASPLPPMPQPVLRLQSDGSAFVDLNVPAGLTEAIVFVMADSCVTTTSPKPAPNRYSVLTKATGQQTLFIPGNLGPLDATGAAMPTFCTAAYETKNGYSTQHTYVAAAVGFDYPAREASYPDSTSATPAITNGDGHSGTADVTTSRILTVSYQSP